MDESAELVSREPGDVEQLELSLLCEAIFRRYGCDFREYANASLMRRVFQAMQQEGVETISRLQDRVLRDEVAMARLINHISVNVTSMFRDTISIGTPPPDATMR